MNIKDVRAEMPNYDQYKEWERKGEIIGLTIHHSETVNRATGAPIGNSHSLAQFDVQVQGRMHGSYNYIILPDGTIEYALDEEIPAYHADFYDPSDLMGLEYGQYWNNHYLAICLVGWFSNGRTYRGKNGHTHPIPDDYTTPTEAQQKALLRLCRVLQQKYNITIDNIRGHRELAGNQTTCPGFNVDLAHIRQRLAKSDIATVPPTVDPDTIEIKPGEHVVILPDTDKYLNAAMIYLWKFKPDTTFAMNEATGRWKYITVVGNPTDFSDSQLTRLRQAGAQLVQRIPGDPNTVRDTLDNLANNERRFLALAEQPAFEPVTTGQPRTYTVQPGDTLSAIAKQIYGSGASWRMILEANRTTIDNGRIYPGQLLTIPPA